MRNYALVSPIFWVGTTGRALRKVGQDAQVLALYLMTCPTSQMYGLYYLPKVLISQETGIKDARIDTIFKVMADISFAYYDDSKEFVWVVEMARWQLQLDQPLKPGDRRVTHANHWYATLPSNVWLEPFYNRYHYLLHLADSRSTPDTKDVAITPQTPARMEAAIVPIKQSSSELFERWWSHYPKKVGKKAAFGEWMKINPTDDFVDRAIQVVEAQKRTPEWLKEGGQFIPDPERWLKKGRWDDDITVKPRLSEPEAGTAKGLMDWAQRKSMQAVIDHDAAPPLLR